MITPSERIWEVRAWAESRVRACREQETKFAGAWQHREKHSLGPPQALVEAWTERRALQVVLEMLGFGSDVRSEKGPGEP